MAARSYSSRSSHQQHYSLASALPTSIARDLRPSSSLRLTNESSAAVTNAMRALQDKIKSLEERNEAVSNALQQTRQDWADEKRRWEELARRDGEALRDSEEVAMKKVAELQDRLHQQRLKELSLEEHLHSLTQELHSTEESSLRSKETIENREQSLQVRCSTLEKQLEQRSKELQITEQSLLQMQKDKSRAEAENTELRGEIERVRTDWQRAVRAADGEKAAMAERIRHTEEMAKTRVEELVDKVRKAEGEKDKLREVAALKDRQIEVLREEVEGLRRAHALSESARMVMCQESEKARRLVLDLSLSKERLGNTLRDSRRKGRQSSKKPPLRDTEDIHAETAVAERELARLNDAYRSVLERGDSMDLSTLREQLNDLARKMEEKRQHLADLRNKQTEAS